MKSLPYNVRYSMFDSMAAQLSEVYSHCSTLDILTSSALVLVFYQAAHYFTSIDVLVVQDNYKLASC